MGDDQKLRDTQPKWTAGPWHPGHIADPSTKCNCLTIVSDGGCMGGIANVLVDNGQSLRDGGNDCPSLEAAIANSHLIAAAPELYQAVFDTGRYWKLASRHDWFRERQRDAEADALIPEMALLDAKVDAALAKARGET